MAHSASHNSRQSCAVIAPALGFLAGPLLYAALFMAGQAAQYAGVGLRLWLAFCGVAVVMLLLETGDARPRTTGRTIFGGIGAALFCGAVALLLLHGRGALAAHPAVVRALPLLTEISPLIFGLLALACAWTWGLPHRDTLQRLGGWLGLLVVCDTLRMLAFSQPQRLLGDHDTLATLLLIAMSASLRPRRNDDTDQKATRWHRFWILAGLAATLSRTGLITAAWTHLFFGRGSAWKRLPYSLLCLALCLGGFLLQVGMGSANAQYLEYWLWFEGAQLLLTHPQNLCTGFSLSAPLAIVPPLGLMGVWQSIADTSPLQGLMVAQLHPFWLRVTMGWGMLFPCGMTLGLAGLLLFRPSRMGATLAAVIIAQGISTNLFFSPGPAVLLWLALFTAFAPQATATQNGPPRA